MSAQAKRILEARAVALAREARAPASPRGALDAIEFVLAYETYAVESGFVREVHPLRELTPLPCTPRHVLGIVNIRGRIVSVIDLKRFFELPEKGLTDLNKVIVLRSGAMEFGILADAIAGTRAISAEQLQPPPPTLTGIRERYLRGVTGERIALLDAARLLSDRRFIVHEEVGISNEGSTP